MQTFHLLHQWQRLNTKSINAHNTTNRGLVFALPIPQGIATIGRMAASTRYRHLDITDQLRMLYLGGNPLAAAEL
jgi:hypothetical protein